MNLAKNVWDLQEENIKTLLGDTFEQMERHHQFLNKMIEYHKDDNSP